MNIKSTYYFFKFLEKDNLSYFYQGVFNDDITNWLISLSQKNLKNVEEFSKLKKRVAFLMAECFQNVVRHIEEPALKNHEQNVGLFMTRNVGNAYYIASSNLIENKSINLLSEKLNIINTLDKDELKKIYLEILSEGDVSDKGGAGLGLIEMARKSGHKLEFEFKKVTEEFSFFYLQIILKNESISVAGNRNVSIKQVIGFHNEMNSDNILMVYKGDFAQEAIIPIIKMFEHNINNLFKEYNLRKMAFHIVVEILQNISKHAQPRKGIREGIFLIGKDPDCYVVNAGNLIENEKIDKLKIHLDNINSKTKPELQKIYMNTMRQATKSTEHIGLGLVDISRDCRDTIEYNFKTFDDKLSFFSIKIRI